jgi:hypothetical protein
MQWLSGHVAHSALDNAKVGWHLSLDKGRQNGDKLPLENRQITNLA